MTGSNPMPAKRIYRPRGIPAYPTVGRQPEVLHIVPSRPNPWYGAIVAGDELTQQQRHTVAARGFDAEARITVRRLASSREYWWPIGVAKVERPYFEFQCPIARRQRDGRIYVVAPGGEVKLVHADGWVF